MRAYRWAKAQRLQSPAQKFVLVMLADHYNEEFRRAWPGHARLVRETGYSRSTIIRAIQALERDGLVEVEPWVNAETGEMMTNRYYLPLFDPASRRSKPLVRADPWWDHDGKREYYER